MKDVNFLMALDASPKFINLGEVTRRKLLCQVKRDVDFLASLGLMDYSILLGIETLKKKDTRSESVPAFTQENDFESKFHQIGALRSRVMR